jgi:aspartyl-tRNA(Asn)/glutamyl-tRNA(Gln) amidotransferase subunit B
LFSGASTAFGAEPNTQVSLVDAAMPGMLPVPNEECVKQAVRTGLAIGAEIHRWSRFDRKNYFYADLPQGYQISQLYHPIVGEGSITVTTDEGTKTIGVERIHIEQDAGKLMHDQHPTMSYVDLNRSGVALMEIVSKPDMRSPAEAGEYVRKLRQLVRYIGSCDGNMEQGSMRADVNVSVRKTGEPFGTRTETKNVNSVRFIQTVVEIEAKRQVDVIESGGTIVQETRLFDPDKGVTRSMRSKEDAHDYRYFPDPDLPPLVIERAWVDRVKSEMAELPRVMAERFVLDYALPEYDATTLTQSKAMAAYFEATAKACGQPKLASNWIMGEVSRRLNAADVGFDNLPVSSAQLGALIQRIQDSTISNNAAKDVFDALWQNATAVSDNGKALAEVDALIDAKGLKQMNDTGALEAIIDEVLAANPKNVEEFKAGNAKALNGLVGPIMKASKGKANPAQVNALLMKKLG